MWDLIVLGGGAAGLAAAITASENGERVLILEKMDRVGKKILATGNGRCNLMNEVLKPYPAGDAFARKVFERVPPEKVALFFRHLGLAMRTENEGRVYPASLQASSVLDVLRLKLAGLHVEIRTEAKVNHIKKNGSAFIAECGKQQYHGKRILLATGGKAQEKLGSDGSGYILARSMGHSAEPVRPGLTQLITDKKPVKGLEGIRVRGQLSVLEGSQKIFQDRGEVLFTAYGISGICAMNASRVCHPGSQLCLDLLDGLHMTREELAEELIRLSKDRKEFSCEMLLTGLFVRQLGRKILILSGIDPDSPVKSLHLQELEKIRDTVCCFPLVVEGTKGFDQAQITLGGLLPEEFNPSTMESRITPGFYAAGEILNVHGDCGGYNLMFAFASGILCGLRGEKGTWEDNE